MTFIIYAKYLPQPMDVNSRFADRPVFVTGADGFIGSHLTERLVELNANVYCFVRATSSGELRNIRHLRDEITVLRGDLRDKHSVEQSMAPLKNHSDTIIFHLAAQAHVGDSWDRPNETIDANITGTLNLLQTVVDMDLDIYKFDTAGTSEEYGDIDEEVRDLHDYHDDGRVLLNERSPVNPKSIYATSKLAADFLTMNYHDAYGLPSVTTRMFNNYGPRQNPRYITG
ncbi:MAG: SDR family NAD(P)-dependent oxidoreductase, partial [Halobacteriaceae archaeon]